MLRKAVGPLFFGSTADVIARSCGNASSSDQGPAQAPALAARVSPPLRAAPPPCFTLLCCLNCERGPLPRRQSGSAASRLLAATQMTHVTLAVPEWWTHPARP